jgi:hypothetical protein
MNFARTTKAMAVCLAVVGLCLPQPLLAAVQADRSPAMADVALQKGPQGNVLVGHVLNQQGVGQAGFPVSLYAGEQKLAEAKTDEGGFFAFTNLRGGVYQVMAGENVMAYRVWTPGTAPPAAQPGALVVTGQDVVRGQPYPLGNAFGRLRFWLTHPVVIAGIIATAVAVPVAIHNAKDKDKGKPKSP